MRLQFLIPVLAMFLPAAANAGDDLIMRDSVGSVAETSARIEALVETGPPTLVAKVDHQANAASVGVDIPASIVLIFGNPALGTPIIEADPRAAFDLPVRVLIWDDNGKTKIAYLDPAALKARYGLSGADPALEKMSKAIAMLVAKGSEAK